MSAQTRRPVEPKKRPGRVCNARPSLLRNLSMPDSFSDAPGAAQPSSANSDTTDGERGARMGAAIEAQCHRDEEWFASHPNRRLLARLMAPAECAAFLPLRSGVEFPLERACAVVIGKSGYFYHKCAVRFTPADVLRLAELSDDEILARLGKADGRFFQDVIGGRLSAMDAFAHGLARRKSTAARP